MKWLLLIILFIPACGHNKVTYCVGECDMDGQIGMVCGSKAQITKMLRNSR